MACGFVLCGLSYRFLQIRNRENYAQDLQLSMRGFGARSTFGVRGIRRY